MQLISDIINELVESSTSLSAPLLKTKVLASRLKNSELLSWVDKEINGYYDTDSIPEYRLTGCSVIGTYMNGRALFTRQPLPIGELNNELNNLLYTADFSQGISALESLSIKGAESTLYNPFPSNLLSATQNIIVNAGNPYFSLISAGRSIPTSSVIQTLSSIRSKLLDFMLKLDEEFGNITEIEELKTKNREITYYMNQTIINNSGDGNVINTGDNSKITATINVTKGNKDVLMETLRRHNVDEGDIQELIEVIDNEIPNQENITFGTKVSEWLKKMYGKAVDGSWSIGLGVAGQLLADAISKYYGF